MNIRFGSSTLSIPFAFPDGSLSAYMTAIGYPVSSARVEALTVSYWDAIDAKKTGPLMPGTDSVAMARRRSVLSALESVGYSRAEASAYIAAMLNMSDTSWLSPSWSYAKTVFQEATGTGAQGSGGSGGVFGAIPWKEIAFVAGGMIILYGIATTATRTVLTR